MFFKDCKVMTHGQNLFHQPIKNDLRTYDKARNLQLVKEMITPLVVCYFKEHYNLIAIDLSKQQTLDADPKAM